MSNENVNVQEQETALSTNVQRETENYVIIKDENGKFSRKAKFQSFSTINVETRQDKIWMMNLLEGAEGTGNGLKEHVGKQIVVADIITRPYDKINEETGELEYGVLTYLITADRVAYVTSSKTVYFSINRMVELFGEPSKEEPFTIKVGKEKGVNGDLIKIKMIG
jgi:hypothetical protein